ncbi:nuclear transport factor 2 family protein [Mycobacterium sp. ML4]
MTATDTVAKAFAALGRQDLDGVLAQMHDDMVDVFPTRTCRGKAPIRGYFTELFASFPDAAMTVDRIVGDESTAVVEWTLRATFTGAPYEGVLANGRRVELRGVDVIDVADGLERHNRIYYDTGDFLRQIGLLPAAGSPGERSLRGLFNAGTRVRRAVFK